MPNRLGLVILVTCGLCRPHAGAQERPAFPPQPSVVVTPTAPPMVLVPVLPAPGTRDVWKNYSVDYAGRFRPRVVLAPYEASYYYRDGRPYPFFPSRPLTYRTHTDVP